MVQPAYDALSEKRRLESAGFAASQAEAIVETMTRTMTANNRWDGMTQDMAYIRRQMLTKKDLETACANFRAEMHMALLVQGLLLGTLIVLFVLLVAAPAVT